MKSDELRARLQAVIRSAKRASARPRLFTLTYDRTKLKSANPVTRLEYQKRLMVWGAQFPHTGDFPDSVCLQNGTSFLSLIDLDEHFSSMGAYVIEWQDEQESEDAAE